MADIIAFPSPPTNDQVSYLERKVVGAESGIAVRILSRQGHPSDLLVILDGTFEGCTTVAALQAGRMEIAEVVAHSTLVALEAAKMTWNPRNI